MGSDCIITLDTDWAPDFVIQSVLEKLAAKKLKATVFCTNSVDIDKPNSIEFGLHPNFMPDSTQGNSEDEILENLSLIFPKAKGIRTHRLYYHSGLNAKLKDFGIQYDCSILMPFHPHLQAVKTDLLRYPYFWSDNIHINRHLCFDRIDIPNMTSPGLKIFDFHPIHIYLNTNSLDDYRRILSNITDLCSCRELDLKKHINNRDGIGVFFDVFCDYILKTQKHSLKLEDLLP